MLVGPPACEITNFDAVPTAEGTRLLTACDRYGVFGAYGNGRRWSLLGNPRSDEPDRVGASATGTLFVAAGGVHRSLDMGQTWEEVLDSGAAAFLRGPEGAFYVFAERWYRTIDEGTTWTHGNLPGEFAAVTVLPGGRIVLCVEGVFDGVYQPKVFLSDDGGISWREATAPLPLTTTLTCPPSPSATTACSTERGTKSGAPPTVGTAGRRCGTSTSAASLP
jgi:hypothetical protein